MIIHKLPTALLALVLGVLIAFSFNNAQATAPTPQVVPAVLPSTTTTSTTLPALVTTCTQVATLALAEGLPQTELETALRVAVRESRCTSDAFNPHDTMGGKRRRVPNKLLLVQTLDLLAYWLATSPRHFGRLRTAL